MKMSHNARVSVQICLAEPLLQIGVQKVIGDEADLEFVGAATYSGQGNADVLIADTRTVGLVASPGAARILVITPHVHHHAVRYAPKQGIHGFLLATSPACSLLAGIRALARGENYLCGPATWQLSQRCRHDALTVREVEVLHLLAQGLGNKSIGNQLGISVWTVKTHLKSIFAKLDANSRTMAANIAAELGMLDPHSMTAASNTRPDSARLALRS